MDTSDLGVAYSMGVVGGELFISASGYHGVHVWAMKDNGANKGSSQIVSFQNDDDDDKWTYGPYQPIKYLNNGALLMFHLDKHAFICKDPKKTGFRYLRVHGFEGETEAIAHIPSSVPLKLALSGHNVKILKVNSSRSVELTLRREGQVISIVEENGNIKCESKDMDQELDSE